VAPNANNTVHILTGTTVTATFGSVYHAYNMTVEPGARLWNNNTGATNLSYVSIYGTMLRCDGDVGNGATLDGISFNIEGTNVLVSGTGQFNAARIRKNFNSNPVSGASLTSTSLTIAMDVNLRFSGGTNTMIYNNFSGTSTFNVTINAGSTVSILGAGGQGNVGIDGVDGTGAGNRSGTFTVNGTLLVTNIVYISTNNTAGACAFVINTGGYVRTAQVSSAASGAAGHTFTMAAGATLELTGVTAAWATYSATNNTFLFHANSLVDYTGLGTQNVAAVAGGYGNLRIGGSGTKSLGGNTLVKGDLDIVNTLGAAVLDVSLLNRELTVLGNWNSYGETAFTERTGTARVVFSGTATQVVNTTGGERFNVLRVATTGGADRVRFDSDVTVGDSLRMVRGVIDLNGNALSIGNTSPSGISSPYAFGTLRYILSERTDMASTVRWTMNAVTGARTIPFGTASAYVPFTFDHTAGNAGVVSVATYGTPADNLPWPVGPVAVNNLNSFIGLTPDNRTATVDRFWNVSSSGAPTAALTFNYAASELPGTPYNAPLGIAAQRYDDALNTWLPPLEGQSSSAYQVTVPGVTGFGTWALSAMTSPLPIELLSFGAEPSGSSVDLNWMTATERDNAYFTVLRSADALHFTEVTRITGAGVSLSVLSYAAVDDLPLPGVSYYKLRQTDVDGRSTESQVVAVYRQLVLDAQWSVYPNPATDHITLVGQTKDEITPLRILDMQGRQVLYSDGNSSRIGIAMRSR